MEIPSIPLDIIKDIMKINTDAIKQEIVKHYRDLTDKAIDEDKWDEWRKFNKTLRSYGIDTQKFREEHNIMPL